MEIRKDYIPTSKLHRPGIAMRPKFVTVHSTGNPSSTAKNERNWLTNPSNTRQASFHIVVDEKETIQCMPLNEIAYHAGDGQGNGNPASVGIEICESGNREQTLKNAANVFAQVMKQFNIHIEKMAQHNYWTGKNCPRILRDKQYVKNGMDWNYFVGLVKKELDNSMPEQKVSPWAQEAVGWAKKNNISDGERPQDAITREEVITLLYRLALCLK